MPEQPSPPQHSTAREFGQPPSACLDALAGGLVVSCQAPPGDPLHGPAHMTAMARAAALGGAAGIRANGVADVSAIAAEVELPLIGLWKDGTEGVYITPTVRHALAVAAAGAGIVAVDATARPRPDGGTFAKIVAAVHGHGALVMADVATLDEGVRACDAGADVVGTTLSGYTSALPPGPEPDLALVEALAARLPVPVIAEGRLHTPEQVRAAFRAGAHCVVIGTAVTAPAWITRRFAEATPAARRRDAREAGTSADDVTP